MEGYLGRFEITESVEKPDNRQLALLYIQKYGTIDGENHKMWVLDQIARLLNGASVRVHERRWKNGHREIDYEIVENEQYHNWVAKIKDGEDGPETYGYSTGIAP